MPSEQIERGRDEPQHAGKDKRGSDRSPAGRPTMSRSAGTVKLPRRPRQSTAKAMKNPSMR